MYKIKTNTKTIIKRKVLGLLLIASWESDMVSWDGIKLEF